MAISADDRTRFMEALRDDPEFLQRVPQSVLIADLLELGGHLATFTGSVSSFVTRQARANARDKRSLGGDNERRATLDTSPEAIHKRLAQTDALYDNIKHAHSKSPTTSYT